MRLSQITFVLAAVLSTATAQGLSSLPTCASTCVTGSLPKKCGLDVACICKSEAFLNNIACCVADKCSQQDQETTLKVAQGICARGGVHGLPSTVSCSTGSGEATATETTTSETASQTVISGTVTPTNTEASATPTAGSSTASSAASSGSTAAATGAAVLGQNKDASLMAAAGAAAAFAVLL